MASETSLLSDLCKICHNNPPKYRCPRCFIRTCSLTCTKRHKLWAQCSGIRNTAAYKTRSQLATPTSIDHDFNFISSIERKLESADRDAAARGVLLHNAQKARSGPAKGEVKLLEALERCKVIIDKVPGGMSRSKANKTSWSKQHQCLSWTIEWITENGTKFLGTCLEKDVISEAYTKEFARAQPPIRSPKKRSRKRKREVAPSSTLDSTASHTFPNPSLSSQKAEPEPLPMSPLVPNQAPSPSLALETPPSEPRALTSPNSQPPKPADSNPPPSDSPPASPLHFYLHLPFLSSKPTLFPLHPSSTLKTVLGNRVVLEFPTIYILTNAPGELEERFIVAPTERAGGERDGDG